MSDVRSRAALVAVRGENGGHRSSATARLPDWATKLEALEQCLGDPIRRGVEVAASPVVSGNMDGAIICGRRRRRTIRLCRLRPDNRQGVLMWPDRHQWSGRSRRGLHRLFQFPGRPERDLLAGLDLDGLAGRRVPSHPGGPLPHLEDAETGQTDFVAPL